MFEQYIMPLIQEILYLVIIAVVPVLAKFIVGLIMSKKAEIEARTDTLVFQDTLMRAIQLVQDAVDTTSQTYVDALKAEGKFDEESQKKAMEMTIAAVSSVMDEGMKEMISTFYTDFDAWVKIQIESYINNK